MSLYMKQQKPYVISCLSLIPFIFGKAAQMKILLGKKSSSQILCNYILGTANSMSAQQNSAMDLLLQVRWLLWIHSRSTSLFSDACFVCVVFIFQQFLCMWLSLIPDWMKSIAVFNNQCLMIKNNIFFTEAATRGVL